MSIDPIICDNLSNLPSLMDQKAVVFICCSFHLSTSFELHTIVFSSWSFVRVVRYVCPRYLRLSDISAQYLRWLCKRKFVEPSTYCWTRIDHKWFHYNIFHYNISYQILTINGLPFCMRGLLLLNKEQPLGRIWKLQNS